MGLPNVAIRTPPGSGWGPWAAWDGSPSVQMSVGNKRWFSRTLRLFGGMRSCICAMHRSGSLPQILFSFPVSSSSPGVVMFRKQMSSH